MRLKQYAEDFTRFFFPNTCKGCGRDLYSNKNMLCWQCLESLPRTSYELLADNPTARIFYGRLPVENAFSYLFFNKGSLAQHLVHQVKYRRNLTLGFYLGTLMAAAMQANHLYDDVDVLVPLPLNKKKLEKRGFNQSMLLCEGISSVLQKPVENVAVLRKKYTETQTHKTRLERLANVDEVFGIKDNLVLENKHVLLVDDVITTGATMEACGKILCTVQGLRLSMASFAATSKF